MKVTHLRLIGLGLALTGALMFLASIRKTVILEINGQPSTAKTLATTVGEVFRQQGITLSQYDRVWPEADQPVQDSEIVQLEQAVPVTIWFRDRQIRFSSPERRPANLLALAGLDLYPGDQIIQDDEPVSPEELLPRAASYQLRLKPAVRIDLQVGEASQILYTTAPTFGQALAEIHLDVHASDHFDPPLDALLTEDLNARLTPSLDLSIHDQDRQVQIRSAAPTIGDALAEAGLALQGLDYSQPDASLPLPQDGQIQVVRVTERVSIEQEPIEFETELQPAPEVELDSQAVLQPGEFGLRARRVRTRIENGEEVSQQVEFGVGRSPASDSNRWLWHQGCGPHDEYPRRTHRILAGC